MSTRGLNKSIEELAAANVAARRDAVEAFVADLVRRGTIDNTIAPLFSHQLIHTYSKVQETVYPNLIAANGEVLPIDSSVDPAMDVWEDYTVDSYGSADWIGDDGESGTSSAISLSRKHGSMSEMGHSYDLTIFDLERAAKGLVSLDSLKGKIAKRSHDELTNWVWLFGDASRSINGLCNHPNIQVTLAALNAGATSRLPANKTNDEIIADIAALVDAIPTATLSAHFAAKVLVPLSFMQLCKNRRMGTGDGTLTLWGYLKEQYTGDDTGQGKVEFRIMNECDASLRRHPHTGTDDSGIAGDFLLALPPEDKEMLSFIRARAFTQRPPQEVGMKIHTDTHSKIGGCRCQIPMAVHRLSFGTT